MRIYNTHFILIRYIHSIFVVFLHGHYDKSLFDKFTMPKTTHKKHLGNMSSKQIHLFITSCTKPISWLNHCGDFMNNVLLCEISSELNVRDGVPDINVGWSKPRHVSIHILVKYSSVKKLLNI